MTPRVPDAEWREVGRVAIMGESSIVVGHLRGFVTLASSDDLADHWSLDADDLAHLERLLARASRVQP